MNHKAELINQTSMASQAIVAMSPHKNGWSIVKREESGQDVHYTIKLQAPEGREFYISLPWLSQSSCSLCQGQGYIYSWGKHNVQYERQPCECCGGSGVTGQWSEINLAVNDRIFGKTKIRKRNAGLLNPIKKQRGDMIINIVWL